MFHVPPGGPQRLELSKIDFEFRIGNVFQSTTQKKSPKCKAFVKPSPFGKHKRRNQSRTHLKACLSEPDRRAVGTGRRRPRRLCGRPSATLSCCRAPLLRKRAATFRSCPRTRSRGCSARHWWYGLHPRRPTATRARLHTDFSSTREATLFGMFWVVTQTASIAGRCSPHSTFFQAAMCKCPGRT
jgi:hypothetical protein